MMTTHRIFRGRAAAARSLALACLCLCLMATAVHAKGKLNAVKHFDCAEGSIDVVTYSQDSEKVGLLGFSVGDTRVSFAGDATHWPDLINLVIRAANNQAGGSLTEAAGSNKCTITLSPGKPLHMVLTDPQRGRVEITMPAEAVDAFLQSLEEVQTFLEK